MNTQFFAVMAGNWEYVVRGNVLYQYCAGNLRGKPINCASYDAAVDMAVRLSTP